MKHKTKHQKQRTIPCFVFTPETITIAQEAMKLFEQTFQRAEGQPATLAFAEVTMKHVAGKLDTLSTSGGIRCLTTFDYNEKIVMATAIRLYIFELLSAPADAQRARKLHQCQQIEHFALDYLKLEKRRQRG